MNRTRPSLFTRATEITRITRCFEVFVIFVGLVTPPSRVRAV